MCREMDCRPISWTIARSTDDSMVCRSPPWTCPCWAGIGRTNRRSAPGGTCDTWPWCIGRSPACDSRHTATHGEHGSVSHSTEDRRARRSYRCRMAHDIPAGVQKKILQKVIARCHIAYSTAHNSTIISELLGVVTWARMARNREVVGC